MNAENYILRQKDYDVAVLSIDLDGEIHCGKIIDKERVPFKSSLDERTLYRWWIGRAVPGEQERLPERLKSCGCESSHELLLQNLSLSLTDTYWICPEKCSHLRFDDINLFDNGRESLDFQDVTDAVRYRLSPNASVGGSLEKTAVRREDGWYMKKKCSSRYPDGQQNVNELFVSELHRRQGWNEFTPYTVQKDRNGKCIFSICRYFTSKEAELIPADDITFDEEEVGIKTYNSREELEKYIRRCVSGGLDESYVRRSLDYMILMDYVVTNADRHWQNFGVLRDPETLRYLSLAPLYDHGNSMFFDIPYAMNRLTLARLESAGIVREEIRRLDLVSDKTVVKPDLLPSPAEVRTFYAEHGIREDRAAVIASAYSLKLDMFLEYRHGIRISVAREMENLSDPPFAAQQPNKRYFTEHPEDLTEEIRQELNNPK